MVAEGRRERRCSPCDNGNRASELVRTKAAEARVVGVLMGGLVAWRSNIMAWRIANSAIKAFDTLVTRYPTIPRHAGFCLGFSPYQFYTIKHPAPTSPPSPTLNFYLHLLLPQHP